MREIFETALDTAGRVATFIICAPIALIAMVAAAVLHVSVGLLEVLDPLDAEYEEQEDE